MEYTIMPKKHFPLEPKFLKAEKIHRIGPVKLGQQSSFARVPGFLRATGVSVPLLEQPPATSGTELFLQQNNLHLATGKAPVDPTESRPQDQILSTPHAGMNMGMAHKSPDALHVLPPFGITGSAHHDIGYQPPSVVAGSTLTTFHNAAEKQAALCIGGKHLWKRAFHKVHAVQAFAHPPAEPSGVLQAPLLDFSKLSLPAHRLSNK